MQQAFRRSLIRNSVLQAKPRTTSSQLRGLSSESRMRWPTAGAIRGLPSQSWDSHMHVVDPGIYPLAQDAAYTPSPHTIRQALEFESSVGIPNIVLVQPSIYGNDNSCLLDALRDVGPKRGRAVVTIDPEAPPRPEELKEWHALGVRGVRLNLQSVGKVLGPKELEDSLRRYAGIVRPLGWVLQLYVSMETMPALEKIVPSLGVKVCFDHFGSPNLSRDGGEGGREAFDPYSLNGFSSMVSLLRQGNVYVKISAPYRLSQDSEMRHLQAITKELIRVASNRLVFATDWPHTRFEGVDIEPFIKACLGWCGSTGLREMLFRRNAEDLWDADVKTRAEHL